jgi:hypothetical protein
MRAIIVVVVGILSAGCQPPVEIEPDAGSPLAMVDAGLTCPARSHEVDGGCLTEIAWARATSGFPARDHHGTYLWEGNGHSTLVVLGGVDMDQGLAFNDSYFTAVPEDGFITSWSPGPKPLFWQSGLGVDGKGDRIYAVSGITMTSTGTDTTPRVQSLSINPDGTPRAWREEKPLPGVGRFHITATRVGDWLFAMGGRTNDGRAMKEIWRAKIGADGVLSDWVESRSFPQPRTHHASFAVGNRLFLSGGFDALTFTSEGINHRDVLTATVDPTTGELSEWTTFPLPWDVSTHSAGVMDGYVYLVGGFDGELHLLDLVRRAKVNDDGTLGEFVETTRLLQPRAHVHQTPMSNGRIFSVGGNVGGHVTTDAVMVGFLY